MRAAMTVRDRGTVVAGTVAALLVVVRSIPHVFYANAHFDSDQARVGIQALDIVHFRAVPFYLYAQKYLLSLESWLAAPLFAVFGPSVTALKIPLLVMNVLVAFLLVRGFRR